MYVFACVDTYMYVYVAEKSKTGDLKIALMTKLTEGKTE